MGGPRPAVLGLLCLLSRAVLPGFAQEVSTNQNADLGLEVPAASTVSSIVTSAVRRDSTSIVSEFSDVTRGGKTNETIAVTYPPPSEGPPTISLSEPFTVTSAITEEPQETDNSTGGAAPSQGDTETRGVTQPPPTTHTLTTPVTGEVTTGTPSIFTESPLLPSTPSAPTQNNTETPPGSTHPADTTPALRANQTSSATNLPITTTAQLTSPAAPTAATPPTTRPEEESEPTLLEVGDVREVPHLHTGSSSNPLFVMIVSVFTIVVVMVVVGVGFHRYKKRNRRTDFRRLQDLPMDDMMEDTPLALYSY